MSGTHSDVEQFHRALANNSDRTDLVNWPTSGRVILNRQEELASISCQSVAHTVLVTFICAAGGTLLMRGDESNDRQTAVYSPAAAAATNISISSRHDVPACRAVLPSIH